MIAKQDTPTKAYMPISRSDMARNVRIRSLSMNVGVFALGGSLSFFGITSAFGASGRSTLSTIFPKPLPSSFMIVAVVKTCGVLSVGLAVVTVVAAAYLVALVVFPIQTTCGWRGLVDGIVGETVVVVAVVVGGSVTVL